MPGQDSPSAAPAAPVAAWVAPEALRSFLCDCVRSQDGLEILRLLAEPPARWWSVADVAGQLQLVERGVADTVQALIDARLLVAKPDGTQFGRCRDAQIQKLIEESLAAYREHSTEVVHLLTSRAVTRVRLSMARLTGRLLRRHS